MTALLPQNGKNACIIIIITIIIIIIIIIIITIVIIIIIDNPIMTKTIMIVTIIATIVKTKGRNPAFFVIVKTIVFMTIPSFSQ